MWINLMDYNFCKCAQVVRQRIAGEVKSLRCRPIHRECSYKSPGERILKIGPHLPKLLPNIKGLAFLEHRTCSALHFCCKPMQLDGHFGTLQSSRVRHNVQQYGAPVMFTIRHQKKISHPICYFLLPPNFFQEASCFLLPPVNGVDAP